MSIFFFLVTISINFYVLETFLGVYDDMNFLLISYMQAFNIPSLVIYVCKSSEYDVYLGVWFPMGSPTILTVCWGFLLF